MSHPIRDIEKLEEAFWKALVDKDVDTATALLAPKALMASGHGAFHFDPAQYAKMLESPKSKVLDYTLSDMDILFPTDDIAIATYGAHQSIEVDGRRMEQDVFDSSTWVRMGGTWKCVAHSESEAAPPGN